MTAADEDFESLPPQYPFTAHMAAGALAGMAEHGLMYPLDTIKTRMQILSSESTSVTRAVSSIVQAEGNNTILLTKGIRGLWKGIGSLLLGAGPSHAVYFAAYEEAKEIMDVESIDKHSMRYILSTALSGAVATMAADAIMTPFDVIKQRMQLGYQLDLCPSPTPTCPTSQPCPTPGKLLRYSSMMHCFSHTIRTEGFKALYVSYPTTIAMSIPFQSIHFAAYEQFRALLTPIISPDAPSPLTHIVSGGLAGATAAFLTTPLDVSKTLLQTKGLSNCPKIRNANSLADAVRIIYTREGMKGFFRGGYARLLGAIPATGFSWMVYEYVKRVLRDDKTSYGQQQEVRLEQIQ